MRAGEPDVADDPPVSARLIRLGERLAPPLPKFPSRSRCFDRYFYRGRASSKQSPRGGQLDRQRTSARAGVFAFPGGTPLAAGVHGAGQDAERGDEAEPQAV